MLRNVLLLFALFLVFSYTSCSKESFSSGNSTIAYESGGNLDIMSNFAAFVNTSELFIENARPYEDIHGAVLRDAKQIKIDDESVFISDVTIDNVRLSFLELYSPAHSDSIKKYLSSAELVLSYQKLDLTYENLTIATFTSVNTSARTILFDLSSSDLTSFINNRPDRLSFKFQLNERPQSPLRVTYRLGFDYNYLYNVRRK